MHRNDNPVHIYQAARDAIGIGLKMDQNDVIPFSIIMLNVRYLCTTNVTVIILDEMPYHFEGLFSNPFIMCAHFFCVFSLLLLLACLHAYCCCYCCRQHHCLHQQMVYVVCLWVLAKIRTSLLRVKKQLKTHSTKNGVETFRNITI